jgi:hypothetical protein
LHRPCLPRIRHESAIFSLSSLTSCCVATTHLPLYFSLGIRPCHLPLDPGQRRGTTTESYKVLDCRVTATIHGDVSQRYYVDVDGTRADQASVMDRCETQQQTKTRAIQVRDAVQGVQVRERRESLAEPSRTQTNSRRKRAV